MPIIGAVKAGERSGAARLKLADKRRQSIIALHTAGLTLTEIAKRLNISYRTVQRDVRELSETLERVDELLEDVPVDAEDLHIRLSQMFDADYADIVDEQTGAFKPLHRWPKIWRQMLTGVDVKELMERSKDGGDASWDKIGELVKIKFADQLKVIELLMRHNAVGALVEKVEHVGELTIRWEGDEEKAK